MGFPLDIYETFTLYYIWQWWDNIVERGQGESWATMSLTTTASSVDLSLKADVYF
jgi:hypothetical protein